MNIIVCIVHLNLNFKLHARVESNYFQNFILQNPFLAPMKIKNNCYNNIENTYMPCKFKKLNLKIYF